MAYKKLKLWFDKKLAKELADKIVLVKPDFSSNAFINDISKQLKPLELKDRVTVFADQLNQYLGLTYKKNVAILLKILGPENEEETGMFFNYYWIMPIARYVEKYGLGDFKTSMRIIAEITKRNTSEYAIRPFIEQDQEKTMEQLLEWSTSKNKHLRRLASEGPRPRLPWATKLQCFIDNPSLILPILNNLKDDESKYVQKSVANCINDILKDNPEIVKKLIEKWNKRASPQRKWIIKHALRNLRKQQDPWALGIVSGE